MKNDDGKWGLVRCTKHVDSGNDGRVFGLFWLLFCGMANENFLPQSALEVIYTSRVTGRRFVASSISVNSSAGENKNAYTLSTFSCDIAF